MTDAILHYIPGAARSKLLDGYLRGQFFVPSDVREELALLGWKFQKVQVIEHWEYMSSISFMKEHAEIIYIDPVDLVAAAKKVAVSVRSSCLLGPDGFAKKIILLKMWMETGKPMEVK